MSVRVPTPSSLPPWRSRRWWRRRWPSPSRRSASRGWPPGSTSQASRPTTSTRCAHSFLYSPLYPLSRHDLSAAFVFFFFVGSGVGVARSAARAVAPAARSGCRWWWHVLRGRGGGRLGCEIVRQCGWCWECMSGC